MGFEYFIPVRLLFGAGMLDKLGEVRLPGKKALIVISAGGSMKRNGYLGRVQELLRKNGVDSVVYEGVQPNPTLINVREGAAVARENRCDFIIGLGGGSSIDASKSIAVMAVNEGDYWDYISGGSGKGLPVPHDPLPVVAITTTAGTGTEADPWTVVTKEDTREKIGFGYEGTFPVLSIVDPELMASVPPHLTAYQGFDALFHATEGYIADIATEVSDMFALKSIELIGRSLPRAVRDGGDMDARTDMALANTLSGMVESTSSCTSEHSLEHALSAYHPALPHGAGLIMISEAYYTFFAGKVPERLIRMAKALGKEDAGDPMDFVDKLAELKRDCGVADLKMSDFGIPAVPFEEYARNAMDTMGGLFALDRYRLSVEEAASILANAAK